MRWHLDVLNFMQRKVLSELCPHIRKEGFYLAGETAIALHFGHRHSVDLDFFSEKEPKKPTGFADNLKRLELPIKVNFVEEGTLYIYLSGVKISFIRFSYPFLSAPEDLHSFSCPVASLEDLGAMKLLALAQRGSKKDFIDLYALLKKFSLEELLEFYRKKFSVEDVSHVLYSLGYFEDADLERTPRMLWNVNWREVKRFIIVALREYIAQSFR